MIQSLQAKQISHGWARFILVSLFWVSICFSVAGDEVTEAGLKIRASYVFSFLPYTEWKNDSGGEIKIAVMASEEFLKIFNKIEEKRVWDRPIKVIKIKTLKDLPKDCHVLLVIDQKEEVSFVDVPEGILTISDHSKSIEKGVMMKFYEKGERVHFEINYPRVRLGKIRLSSRLLKSAKLVR